jgi:hypothetical protein
MPTLLQVRLAHYLNGRRSNTHITKTLGHIERPHRIFQSLVGMMCIHMDLSKIHRADRLCHIVPNFSR